MDAFSRKFQPLYERWRKDIRVFAKEALNMEPTWQQQQLLDLVQLESYLPYAKRKKRIAVRSGQGPGKTTITTVCALWRCLRYPNALCIVTSPSMRQCKQWVDELKRVLSHSHPVLRAVVKPYETKIEIAGSKMWGVRTATATRPQNLQGIHEERLTFVVDEASGVSPAIIETIKGTLSNPDALCLMIGNPNTTSCTFYECFTSFAHMWHTLHWNAEDTARDYPHIVSEDRNRQIAEEYGIDSDVYAVRVKGDFPAQDADTVMGLADLTACTKTDLMGCAGIKVPGAVHRAFGIDFARFGSDESVVVQRTGMAVTDMKVFVKTEPARAVDYAFQVQHRCGWSNDSCWYIPDAGGMGQGLMASFHDRGKRCLEFLTQARPFNSKKFADLNSEAWWGLRELVRYHLVRLPNDPRLIRQLSTRRYCLDKDNKLKVESKDEWRKRLEITESPDRADAVVQAFYPHLNTAGGIAKGGTSSSRPVGSSLRIKT